MMLIHNSNLMAKPSIEWGNTDIIALPRNAFAHTGDSTDKTTWKYPHHFTMGAIGTETITIMWLSRQGLLEAMESAGNDQDKHAIEHLAAHAKAIGIDEETSIDLLGISSDKYTDMTSNITHTTITHQTGGNEDMDDNIKKLQTKVDELEGLLAIATSTIATMEAAGTEKTITDLRVQIENMTAEKLGLDREIEELTATINGANAFATIGKQAVDALKADILKIAAQVDGETFDKILTDKQIEAFGNDFEILTKFKGQYMARRKTMFKAGDLNQDDYDRDDHTSASAEALDYNIGRQIGGGKVIDIKR